MLTLEGMGGGRTEQRHVCEECGDPSRPAQERGVAIPLGVVRCDPCWERLANELAEIDGVTDRPTPEPDAESTRWIEPDNECPRCGMEVRPVRTNYDRWVNLATSPMRAKEVPRPYRWRVRTLTARHSAYPIGVIAVKVSGIEPLPDDPVTPAHTVVCADPVAIEEVRRARLAEVERQYRLPPSVGEFEDE
ncbi:hypothetical protein [Actinacidiphila acidipaludis]|uniref:Uncharacterized protein n=1 Tax=Actinacidiphila acidipaludis TaxID=2873382 RepID=A0ABS7Q651_9ACTN|nr:hypothetical protein [Streptomyces acidipaludis]MBY8878633.1 hypothetical protein [Streptomyces acidipaludis]